MTNALSIFGNSGEDPMLSFYWKPNIATFPKWEGGIELKATDLSKVDLPFETFEQQSVYLAGSRRAFAGSVDALQFNMTISVYKNPRAVKWVKAWQLSQRSVKGFYGLPVHYKKDLEFFLTDTKGKTVITVKTIGTWILSPGNLSLDYGSSEPVVIDASFSCDRADYFAS